MSPSKKPRVLLTGDIDWAHDEWNALRDVATLEVVLAAALLIA
jgi:predicted phosphohydrolase